jgi:hypothetical protein
MEGKAAEAQRGVAKLLSLLDMKPSLMVKKVLPKTT